jgi:hypothetical protein
VEIRTKERTETIKTITHTAMVNFDTLVVSTKNYYQMLMASVQQGIEPKFKISRAEYLPDEIAVLQLNGELVATITLEE